MDEAEDNEWSQLVRDLQGRIKKLEQENAELRRRKILQVTEVKQHICNEVTAAVLQALSIFHGEQVAANAPYEKFSFKSDTPIGFDDWPDND
jgi:hypothetical protein